jgi:hypothetical protein
MAILPHMEIPRGIRNNNPGNVRLVPGVHWSGAAQEQTDPSFVQFIAPEWGIRAIVRIMRSYERQGIHTIHDAINRWAPPNENNSVAYVDAVCAGCRRTSIEVLSLEDIILPLVKAIILHENGVNPYPDEMVIKGISIA